jgi:Domain of unknown function (DUF4288)
MWYAAHVIMNVEFKDPADQTSYPLWENIVLVEADSDRAAWEQAERLGREDETDGTDNFRWNGRPARWKFAGVRKVIECRSDEQDDRPVHGAEVSYSQMSVPDKESLAKLVQGKAVEVLYEE